jgi:hypothetical protein
MTREKAESPLLVDYSIRGISPNFEGGLGGEPMSLGIRRGSHPKTYVLHNYDATVDLRCHTMQLGDVVLLLSMSLEFLAANPKVPGSILSSSGSGMRFTQPL